MRAVAHKTLFGAGLFVLTLFDRVPASIEPYKIPPQTQIKAQGSRENKSTASRWFAQLSSPDQEKRREAAMELSQIDGDAAASALLSALTDSSPRVRAAAAAGLAKRGDAPAVPLLAACLTKDKDAFVRKMAAYALGGFHGTERTAALIAALSDKNSEVRSAAAVSLGDHADTDAVAPLMRALADKSPFVRGHSARALGVNRSSAKQAVPTLSKLLASDDDGEVKRQAATALGSIGDRSALTALRLARHDKDPYLVQAVIESIKILESN